MNKRRNMLLWTLLLFPIAVLAQSEEGNIEGALLGNELLINKLAILGPLAISPYLTICVTSGVSLFGFGDEFVNTHPLLGNWIVFLLSLIATILTSIPNLSKYSKILGLSASWLEDNSTYLLGTVVVLLPLVLAQASAPVDGLQEFGFGEKTIIILLLLAYTIMYLFLVMTVRYFLEILIFLSPIPFVDTAFEILKKVVTLLFILLYFISPLIAFFGSLFILAISGFFFRKSKRITQFFQYMYIQPLFNKITQKRKSLVNPAISIKYFPNQNVLAALEGILISPLEGLKAKSRVAFIITEEGTYICKSRLLKPHKKIKLQDYPFYDDLQIGEDYNILEIFAISQGSSKRFFSLKFNRSYKKHYDDLLQLTDFFNAEAVGMKQKQKDFVKHTRKGWRSFLQIITKEKLEDQRKELLH